jgi:hypothetical protein
LSGGLPTPGIVEQYLAAFYQGGTTLATVDWTVPATIGTVVPKAPGLSRSEATVTLRPPGGGDLPLGFFEITASGHSGSESSTITRRFACMENVWMKHQRAYFRGNEPEDLISWPVFLANPTPGALANTDSILYVENTSLTTTRLRSIPAFSPLQLGEAPPGDTNLLPLFPELNNYDAAPKTQPDIAPHGLGRRELLFSSQMDPQYPQRCPSVGCSNTPPYRLWVVQLADGTTTFAPRALTSDSTFIRFGSPVWYAYDFQLPRWDPKATGNNARIAFLSTLSGSGTLDLWTANLVDRDGDAHSDTLIDYHQLTHTTAIASYDWHPDGTRLCVAASSGLSWVDASSGALTPIAIPDSSLTRFATPAVFWRPGEHTLLAFQAQTENLSNLYVLDIEDAKLTRILPYAMPVTTSLFPRWHPTRKELVYVSDYTVMAWANTTENRSGVPDRLDPRFAPDLHGMPRTLYPSVWVAVLEEQPSAP